MEHPGLMPPVSSPADYSFKNTSISWITHPTRAQYWRIQVISWDAAPAMKADLIGKGKVLFLKCDSIIVELRTHNVNSIMDQSLSAIF